MRGIRLTVATVLLCNPIACWALDNSSTLDDWRKAPLSERNKSAEKYAEWFKGTGLRINERGDAIEPQYFLSCVDQRAALPGNDGVTVLKALSNCLVEHPR